MIILIDLDGPLANFDNAIDQKWNELFPNEPINFSGRETFSFNNLYNQKTIEIITRIFRSPSFFEELSVVEGSQKALADLQSIPNVEIFICSSPMFNNPSSYTGKRNWVYKNFGESMTRRLILTKDKTLIRGDILIDDKTDINGLLTPSWEHILFTKQFNQNTAGKRRLDWSNWQSVLFSK